MENVSQQFIRNSTHQQLEELGKERGRYITSHQPVIEQGDAVPVNSGSIGGMSIIEDADDAEQVMREQAFEAEENDRQFTPNEFWIAAVNERDDAEEAWSVIDRAIADGINEHVQEQLKSWWDE